MRHVDVDSHTTFRTGDIVSLKSQLTSATAFTDAVQIVQDALVAKLAKSMMIFASDIDSSKAIHHYGVDSLVAVELRNWILRELQSNIGLFDILASSPLRMLASNIAKKSEFVTVSSREDLD